MCLLVYGQIVMFETDRLRSEMSIKGSVLEWRNHVVMIVGVFRLSPLKFRAGCSCPEFRSFDREGPSRRGIETTKPSATNTGLSLLT